MYYICDECGHVFEPGEEKKYREEHGEYLTCCPVCGGSYAKAVECECCGKVMAEDSDEYVEGWCRNCIDGAVDYDTFKDYLEEECAKRLDCEYSDLECFFFEWVWDIRFDKHPRGSSKKCKRDLLTLFDCYAEADKLDQEMLGLHPYLDICKSFVAEAPEAFVEFLKRKEKC